MTGLDLAGLMARRLRLAALLATIPVAAPMAAPFCLQNPGLPPQCIYWDPDSCNREAHRQSTEGTCGANPLEVRNLRGSGKYCVVIPGVAPSCIYVDRGTCDQQAARLHAVCSQAQPGPRNVPGVGAPDPYGVAEGVMPPGRANPYAPQR
jgi:hypothetical protein